MMPSTVIRAPQRPVHPARRRPAAPPLPLVVDEVYEPIDRVFERVVNTRKTYYVHFAWSRLSSFFDWSDAEDAAQEAIMRSWEVRDRISRPSDGPVHSWILTTLTRVCMDMGRRRQLIGFVSLETTLAANPSMGGGPDLLPLIEVLPDEYTADPLAVAELREELQRVRSRVTPTQWAVLVAFHVNEIPTLELPALFGLTCAPTTAKTYLLRARRRAAGDRHWHR